MKWDYKVEYNVKPQKLMMYGKVGWELVEVLRIERQSPLGGLWGPSYKYIFKRPKQDAKE